MFTTRDRRTETAAAPPVQAQSVGTEPVAEPAPVAGKRGKVDVLQLLFWVSIVGAIAAATVSLAWHEAVGQTGSILLIALATTGLVVMLWLARGAGRFLGLFPERGAAEQIVAQQAARPRYTWIESLDEAVLITEKGGAPVTCNSAFRQLSEVAAGLGESHGPVTVDRLFGSSPGLASSIYLLSKAAKAEKSRTEILPAMAIGRDEKPVQYVASVAPLPNGRVLWRLRDVTGQPTRGVAADPKALYIEEAPVGFFVARTDGTISYVNAWLRELLGLPEGESVARVDDIMRADSVRMLKREKRGDNITRAQLTLVARDGVEIVVQSVTLWSGRGLEASGRTIVTTAQGAMLDKAARLTAESTSRPARMDSDPLFSDAPIGVVRLGGFSVEDAVITDANPAMMALSAGRAMPGVKLSGLFMAEDGDVALADRLVGAIDQGVTLQLAGEPTVYVNVRIAQDSSGAPATAYLIDMTAQRELEQKVYRGEKMQALGKLMGELAHDFNNILQEVIFNCDKLMVRHPVGDPSFPNLQKINESSARAAELIRSLKAYAKEETVKNTVLDVTEWISEFSLMLGNLVDDRIAFKVAHGRDLARIKVDKSLMESVLMNLTTNARDAMLDPRNTRTLNTLTLTTAMVDESHAYERGFNIVDPGRYVMLSMADTGVGIAPDMIGKMWEPFESTKKKTGGTGLGLSSVYGIVKQARGFIFATSEVGKGATFYVYLPALSPEEEAALPAPEPRQARQRPKDVSGRGRILFVEDEHGIRGIAVNLLRTCGYEVTEASDGEKALAIIEANPGGFDLLISDVIMPGLDGPTLLRKARHLLGDARVIFISGYAERDFAKALDEERQVSFISKPFSMKLLAEQVKREIAPEDDLEQTG
jgi:two-component system cell cycle sensor histidine kinase/response regulator CckA